MSIKKYQLNKNKKLLLKKINIFDNLLENFDFYNSYTYSPWYIKNIYNKIIFYIINIFNNIDIVNTILNYEDLIKFINNNIKTINFKINFNKFLIIIKLYYFDILPNYCYKIEDIINILCYSEFYSVYKLINFLNYIIINNDISSFESYFIMTCFKKFNTKPNLKIIIDYLFNLNYISEKYLKINKIHKNYERTFNLQLKLLNINKTNLLINTIKKYLDCNITNKKNNLIKKFVLTINKNSINKLFINKKLYEKELIIFNLLIVLTNKLKYLNFFVKKKLILNILEKGFIHTYKSFDILNKFSFNKNSLINKLIINKNYNKIDILLKNNIINYYFKNEVVWNKIIYGDCKLIKILRNNNIVLPYNYFITNFKLNFNYVLFNKKGLKNNFEIFIKNINILNIDINLYIFCNYINYFSQNECKRYINKFSDYIEIIIPFLIFFKMYILLDFIFKENIYTITNYQKNFYKFINKIFSNTLFKINNANKILIIYSYNKKYYNIKIKKNLQLICFYAKNIKYLNKLIKINKFQIDIIYIQKFILNINKYKIFIKKNYFDIKFFNLLNFLKNNTKNYNLIYLNSKISKILILVNKNITLNEIIEIKKINKDLFINLDNFNNLYSNYKKFILFYLENFIINSENNFFFYFRDDYYIENFNNLIVLLDLVYDNFLYNDVKNIFYKYNYFFITITESQIYNYIYTNYPNCNKIKLLYELKLLKLNSYFFTYIICKYNIYDNNVIEYLIRLNIPIKEKTFEYLKDIEKYYYNLMLQKKYNYKYKDFYLSNQKKFIYFNRIIKLIDINNIIKHNHREYYFKPNNLENIISIKNDFSTYIYNYIKENENNNLINEL